jgi:hypothetical protein
VDACATSLSSSRIFTSVINLVEERVSGDCVGPRLPVLLTHSLVPRFCVTCNHVSSLSGGRLLQAALSFVFAIDHVAQEACNKLVGQRTGAQVPQWNAVIIEQEGELCEDTGLVVWTEGCYR